MNQISNLIVIYHFQKRTRMIQNHFPTHHGRTNIFNATSPREDDELVVQKDARPHEEPANAKESETGCFAHHPPEMPLPSLRVPSDSHIALRHLHLRGHRREVRSPHHPKTRTFDEIPDLGPAQGPLAQILMLRKDRIPQEGVFFVSTRTISRGPSSDSASAKDPAIFYHTGSSSRGAFHPGTIPCEGGKTTSLFSSSVSRRRIINLSRHNSLKLNNPRL